MSKKQPINLDAAFILSWTEKAPCTFDVAVDLNADAVSSIFDSILTMACKQVAIPGFRPGTAPRNLVLAKHKDAILHDAQERIIAGAFQKITQEPGRNVLGYKLPDEATLSFEAGKAAHFIFEISVAPVVEIPEYKGVSVKVDLKNVDADSVEKRIEQLREAFGEFKDVETGITKSALAQVSYTADVVLEDDAPAKLKALLNAERTWIWFNSEERIPGISEALMGKKKGDKVTFTATFAEDHAEPFLAGKSIAYEVTVLAVQERAPQADDKVLFQRLSVDNMEQLTERLKNDLQQEADMNNETLVGDAVKAEIFAKTPTFEMPASIVEAEANRCMREIAREVIKSQADVAAFQANRDAHEGEAKARAQKNTRELFILRTIAEKENITVSQEELNAQIQGMAQYFGTTVPEMQKRIQENQAETEIANSMLTQKVTAFLAKEAKAN